MQNERMYHELLELITTDAASGQEKAIAEKLIGKLNALGFTVTTDHADEVLGGNSGNIFAWRDGERPGALLLCSHMDRVPNGLGIRPEERDGVLYSDGTTILAADDVSGICAILEGLRCAVESGKPLPRLEVLFTVSEETGLFGAKLVDVSKIQAKIGLFFDSPGPVGRIVNAAPGHYALSADITGLAAHAGNEPEKGINAAKIMCDMISSLKQGRLDEITTSNFPILSTNSRSANVVCDSASFAGEARSRDAERLEAYVNYFKEHCQQVAKDAGAEISLRCTETFRAFCIDENHAVIRLARAACEAIGVPCLIESGGGGMDANVFNAQGIVSVGIATGYSKNHTKSERLVLDDFFRSGKLAATMISLYAAEPIAE